MAARIVLRLFCAFGLVQKGLTEPVQTQNPVTARLGNEAHLSCQFKLNTSVYQVTWEKLSSEREKKLAAYTEKFGERVNAAFRDKVTFKGAGLQNSSIVIRNVTEQDEGCYRCLFNSAPEGAFIGRTCLKVYELHEPTLRVQQTNRTEEAVSVSCSATGRPPPTVTLSVQQPNIQNYSRVSNSNCTVTVTVTVTAPLSGFYSNSTRVGCAVRGPSGPPIEVFTTMPGKDLNENESFTDVRYIILAVVITVIAVILAIAAIIGRNKIKNVFQSLRLSCTSRTPLRRTESSQKGMSCVYVKDPNIFNRSGERAVKTSSGKWLNGPKCIVVDDEVQETAVTQVGTHYKF